jgi:hypothetical protein
MVRIVLRLRVSVEFCTGQGDGVRKPRKRHEKGEICAPAAQPGLPLGGRSHSRARDTPACISRGIKPRFGFGAVAGWPRAACLECQVIVLVDGMCRAKAGAGLV